MQIVQVPLERLLTVGHIQWDLTYLYVQRLHVIGIQKYLTLKAVSLKQNYAGLIALDTGQLRTFELNE